ncbi:MAG: ABC transporter permease subunit [Brachymonas sp.]|jgi:arginine/ornithine transport system permease protein|nr:ABC transporter permease subunit [Brachymonas sp.]MBP6138771.1 ABC transporter permease subunit [Brachymonas sp.]MBP6966003.1 ABC transporter permease subunit [Brachymonas sp.]MBP7246851.1 ABC transporter permease subunit [Brachymonas sp.]MBP7740001.1 ABC transporter permease subunit [Brachymonas sp.]
MSEDSTLLLFVQTLWACIQALPTTLLLTGLSILIGLAIAIPLAVVHHRHTTVKARLVQGFIYFFTGTPLLVQIYIIYYGLPSFDWVADLMQQPGFGFLKDGFIWALMALTLNTAAYSTVIFSGSIRNTDAGEVEAARAYGMWPRQAMWRIILPSSLRRALPAYSNEVIMIMHATSLASTVTVSEMTNAASLIVSSSYRPFVAYSAAAVMYLLLTLILVGGFKLLEKRFMAHLGPRSQ